MDTRTKIIAAEKARLLAAQCRVVAGHFDPLLAGDARRLRESGGSGPLLVVVTSTETPLLESQARAELVAALACVDYVVAAPDADFAGQLGAKSLEEAGRRETAALIAHVKRRVAEER